MKETEHAALSSSAGFLSAVGGQQHVGTDTLSDKPVHGEESTLALQSWLGEI